MFSVFLILLLALITLTHSSPKTPKEYLTCYQEERSLHPTTYRSCFDSIKLLSQAGKPEAPVTFSRKPNVGYRVPDYWTSGNCIVIIDVHEPDQEETMSFYEIAVEAGVVNAKCVARPPHLGGTHVIGSGRRMNVTIAGLKDLNLGIGGVNGLVRNVSVS